MASLPSSPIAVYRGRFTERHATRLLWRAGFGPRPGDVRRLQRLGLEGAVASLTRPRGRARLIGRAAHDDHGNALDPINVWGHDHCWWLDRMVRSNHQLIERMTLVWHSWFATSIEQSNARLMIDQNQMVRARALGNFHDLLVEVTRDPAMLLLLSNNENTKWSPNENYGRASARNLGQFLDATRLRRRHAGASAERAPRPLAVDKLPLGSPEPGAEYITRLWGGKVPRLTLGRSARQFVHQPGKSST